MSITRVQVVDAVEPAFAGGSATREQILAAARQANADAVHALLEDQLPPRRYSTVRDLWNELPHLPVDQ